MNEGIISMTTADEPVIVQRYAMKYANANFIGTTPESVSATSMHYENYSS